MRRRIIISLISVPLVLVIVGLVLYRIHTVPLSECSEVYRHYYKTPGIQAAYIKDMTIDDTIHFDMTLLEARDSATYVWLLRDLGRDEEQIAVQMEYTLEDNPYFVALHNDDIACCFPAKHTAAILHLYRQQDKKALIVKSLHKKIKINQHETNN